MASFRFYNVVTMFCLWVFLISPVVHSQICKSQKLTGNELYTNCLDLPTLKAYLHYTYNSSNSTLSIAFLSSPPSPSGWVAWAINPTGSGMLGAEALLGYKDSKGVMTVKTYSAKGYTVTDVVQQKLAFDVWDERAEEDNGVTKISAKIKIPKDLTAKGTVNQVWQVGPNVDSKGVLTPHAMNPPNFNSKTTLAFSGDGGVQTTASTGGVDSRTEKKNIHGVLNAVSWGILFPVGIIIARYLRTFQSADPAWFYLHVFCQVSAYAVGVSGWAIGLKLGSESKGIQYTGHRNIGIALFSLATLQIFALFLRPKKDHKYRFYWNVYHHGIGYAILILGILNVFKGLDTLHPEEKWRSAYIIVIAVLGGVALLLEIITWLIVLKKSKKSTKPFDGHNGQARQHP